MSAAFHQTLEYAPVIHQRSQSAHMQELPRLPKAAIEVLAHHLWHLRGCPIGSPAVDWFLAERELRYLRLHG